MPTTRTDLFNQEYNNSTLSENLDLLEENREIAMIKLAKY